MATLGTVRWAMPTLPTEQRSGDARRAAEWCLVRMVRFTSGRSGLDDRAAAIARARAPCKET
jgi:hypothetical protein